ncbi:MAG: AAA family ATPase [Rhodospirillales bacterium]|nr:AAA family ATPase [Rhodospirillales bacterium]
MPYLGHFGLKEHPFALTPNPALYFPTADQANLVQAIVFALRRQCGIVKVVGDIGTGKTLLCRILLNALVDKEPVGYINAPPGDEALLVDSVCREFGIVPVPRENPYEALRRFLLAKHAQGKRPVLVVDEAQALGNAGLETIRLLTNLETERAKLLQIVLFGQTELDELLSGPALRQLNQRITHAFATRPLLALESRRYVDFRLRKCRRPDVAFNVFQSAALDQVVRSSRGIPRLINILCDKAMLVAYAEGSPKVARHHVEDAINDSRGLLAPVPFLKRYTTQRVLLAAITAETAVAAVLAMLLLPFDDLGAGLGRLWNRLMPPMATSQIAPPKPAAEDGMAVAVGAIPALRLPEPAEPPATLDGNAAR